MRIEPIRTYDDDDPDLGGAQIGFDGQGIRVARWLIKENGFGNCKWVKLEVTSSGDIGGLHFLEENDGAEHIYPLVIFPDGSGKILVPADYS